MGSRGKTLVGAQRPKPLEALNIIELKAMVTSSVSGVNQWMQIIERQTWFLTMEVVAT